MLLALYSVHEEGCSMMRAQQLFLLLFLLMFASLLRSLLRPLVPPFVRSLVRFLGQEELLQFFFRPFVL